MEHDDAPVGTIFSRREALQLAARAGFGLAASGLFGAAVASTQQKQVNLVASPALTEGPFFVDEKLNRSNLLEGTTREAVVKGVPLELALTVMKAQGGAAKAFESCQVDVWHCDAGGVYSDEDHPMNHENTAGQKWLRGHQITDKKGAVKFKTIFPGWYPGRATHIHFKVRTFSDKHKVTADFTSQLFFHEKDIEAVYAKPPYSGQKVPAGTNMKDNIFGERQADGSYAGQHLLLDMEKVNGIYRAAFVIVLTDKNFSQMGGGPENWSQF